GHGRATRVPISGADFAALADDLAAAPWRDELAAVLTGYFAGPDQVAAAARLVRSLKAARPDLLFLCDPVMGDVRADGS
ncbi:hypothetical protein J8J27_34930, partial [Mycobacterium tuberculosis]|nr:hypothetical protein [Mycobacterium tuberculosis]